MRTQAQACYHVSCPIYHHFNYNTCSAFARHCVSAEANVFAFKSAAASFPSESGSAPVKQLTLCLKRGEAPPPRLILCC